MRALLFVMAIGVLEITCALPVAAGPPITADQDQAILDGLKAHGANLSKPTDIVFYLYIPARTDPLAAARTLRSKGFMTEVQEPLGKLSNGTNDTSFPVVSHLNAIPQLARIREIGALMTSLARRYHGDYDGWEAAVEK